MIEEKLKDADARFEEVKAKAMALQEQVNKGNRQLAEFQKEMIAISGEHRALKALLDEESKETKSKK